MTKTDNCKLNTWVGSDPVDVTQINENFLALDQLLTALRDTQRSLYWTTAGLAVRSLFAESGSAYLDGFAAAACSASSDINNNTITYSPLATGGSSTTASLTLKPGCREALLVIYVSGGNPSASLKNGSTTTSMTRQSSNSDTLSRARPKLTSMDYRENEVNVKLNCTQMRFRCEIPAGASTVSAVIALSSGCKLYGYALTAM